MSSGDMLVGRVRLREPLTVRRAGRAVAVAGQESSPGIDGLSVGEVAARIDGLLAQAATEVVPVVWTAKPETDGWYRVSRADVDVLEFDSQLWRADWAADLDLVGRQVVWETALRRAHRTNTHSSTSTAGEQWLALPPDAQAVDTSQLTSVATISRESDAGTVTVYRAFTPDTARVAWQVPRAGWAEAAALVRTGGQVVTGAGQAVTVDGWEIGNGIVRLAYSPTSGRLGTFSVYTGGEWVELTGWRLRVSGTQLDTVAPAAVEVLHVSPAEAAIRLYYATPRTVVDLAVRRGSRFISCRAQSPGATSMAITTGSETYTDLGGVAQRSSDDGNGHRWCLGAEAWNSVISTGINRTSSSISGFIGALPDHTGLATGNTALSLLAQFIEAPQLVDTASRP